MKTRNRFGLILSLVAAFSLSSCNKFLDEMPDNRTEIDTEAKVSSILVSAYPEVAYIKLTEFSSDNTDEIAYLTNPDYDEFVAEVYNWQDVSQVDNEDNQFVWESYYKAIASANQALSGIENLGGATTPRLKAAMGEALVARAYSHFMLVNIFCQAYDPQYAESDLGVPYMEAPETTLNPQYDRGTVAGVYEKIEADLTIGLPLINDTYYQIPKYHFNRKAACAFAARFYLFYQKWDEAIKYANEVLGDNPALQMRDLAYLASLPEQTGDGYSQHAVEYANASLKCNLMMLTSVSNLGVDFSWWVANCRYNHAKYTSLETYYPTSTPWGTGTPTWYEKPWAGNGANYDKTNAQRLPRFFEFTDPVAQIGYPRLVFPAFTIEEVLLTRAEANIMLKQYNPALDDMNLWVKAYVKSGASTLDVTKVNSWANSLADYKPLAPTLKKRFDAPAFPVAAGTQENMCYALLYMRRVETLHMGLRWFDTKRYGITIYRRQLSSFTSAGTVTSVLKPRDPRCAIQLPDNVISAGITPNPR